LPASRSTKDQNRIAITQPEPLSILIADRRFDRKPDRPLFEQPRPAPAA
jgi:hypothetical protein